jgi:polyphosphate glucokinase
MTASRPPLSDRVAAKAAERAALRAERAAERAARREHRAPLLGRRSHSIRVIEGRESTLSFDVGGTGIKFTVLDRSGDPIAELGRVATPYPCPPERLVDTLLDLAEELPPFERVSVGLPGMIRHGVVITTPHFVCDAGPFTPRNPELVKAWARWDAGAALNHAFGCPVRVINDAELAGFAVIEGSGLEVLLAFGTGLGAALYDDGQLLPKLELSQAPFRDGETYDQQLGDHARLALGNVRWSRRVAMALDRWYPVLGWDRLYLGGGNAHHLTGDLGYRATRVGNEAGVRGGHKLWSYRTL